MTLWTPLRILPAALTLGADTYDLRGWGPHHGILCGEVRIERGDWQRLVVVLARQADGGITGTMSIGAVTWDLRGWGKTDGVLHAEARAHDQAWEEYERGLMGRVEG